MSSRDFVRAGIDEPHHHEHEWLQDEDPEFHMEDGAAIFIEECWYAEGEYGQGWECEETRSYRFEYDTLELLDGGEIDLPEIGEWGKLDEDLAEVIIAIEEAWHNGDSRASINVHPDKEHGEVTLDFLGYTLCYRP